MGKKPTAGSAFLKGTANFEDGSMLAMITGIAYLFNGEAFGKEGIPPDQVIPASVSDVEKYVLSQVEKTLP